METIYTKPGPNRERVRALVEAGHGPTEIAKQLGISRQRVYRIKAILDAIDADKAEQEAKA